MAASDNNFFYLCKTVRCNRKYKTKPKLIEHCLKQHSILLEEADIPDPVLVTKDNKKSVDANKDRRSNLEDLKRRATEQLRIKEQYQEEYAQRLRQIEFDKLKVEEEKLKLEQDLLLRMKTNSDKSTRERVICGDRPPDALVTPCGHAMFCMPCITEYKLNYAHRGCPGCRGPMESIVQVFQ
jgi:hypothetical protein